MSHNGLLSLDGGLASILIGLFLLVSVPLVIYFFFPQLVEKILEHKLVQSLLRHFGDFSKQPLYRVFYKFDHADTESWVAWVKGETELIQERAFSRMLNYLEQPMKKHGLVTIEVVKAVILFEHLDSFKTLTNLMEAAKEAWGSYQVIEQFYEQAAIGLIELDPSLAKTFLVKEIKNIRGGYDKAGMKSHIINALAELPEDYDPVDVLKDISMDTVHSLSIRMRALYAIRDKFNADFIYVLNEIANEIVNDEKRDDSSDIEIYNFAIEILIDEYNIESNENDIWNLIMHACAKEKLADKTIRLLASKMKNANYSFTGQQLYDALEILNSEIIFRAISKRFALNAAEIKLIGQAEELKKIRDENQQVYDKVFMEKNLQPYILPEHIGDLLPELEKFASKRDNIKNIRMILGDDEVEKVILMRTLSAKLKKNFLYANAAETCTDHEKLEKFSNFVEKNSPQYVYLSNIAPVLEKVNDYAGNTRLKKFIGIMKNLFKAHSTVIFASLPATEHNLEKNFAHLSHMFRDLPNEYIGKKFDLAAPEAMNKKKLYELYKEQVDLNREMNQASPDGLADKTEGYSLLGYTEFILKYIKVSLLTEGKLIAANDFLKLIEF